MRLALLSPVISRYLRGLPAVKNLSVYYIDSQRHLAKRHDGRSEVVQCNEASLKLFIAHQQLTQAIEPAMADLHDPAPGPLVWIALLVLGLFATVNHVRNVAMRFDDAQALSASITRVGT
jgi:hypothetical protein